MSRSVEYDNEVDGSRVSTVTTDSQYDTYGNPTRITNSTVDATGTYVKTTVNTYSNNPSNWLLGRLTRTEVTGQLPNGISARRTSGFDYNLTNGLLIKEVIEPDFYEANLTLTTDHGYDAYGNKVRVTVSGRDIETRTSTTSYDAQGRFPIRSTNALGHAETRTYDPRFGSVTRLTGPNGLSTTWSYDGFGRKLNETRADTTQTDNTYNACDAGCPPLAKYFVTTQSTDSPLGKAYFDNLNREIRTQTQGFDGRTVYKDTQYDALGRTQRTSRPYYAGAIPSWMTSSYDILNRPLSVTEADGSVMRMSYQGFTTQITNALNQVSTQVKNSQGQLLRSTDAQGYSNTYTYDPFGNLTQTLDAAGNRTLLSYDIRGRKLTMVDPDMGHWRYSYNTLGELVY